MSQILACRTDVILGGFSGERGQARSARLARVSRTSRSPRACPRSPEKRKNITPVLQASQIHNILHNLLDHANQFITGLSVA